MRRQPPSALEARVRPSSARWTVELAVAAREGSGLPVTVKLRTSRRPDDHAGVEAARRLAWEAGVAGLALHPRSAVQRHKGTPDYALVRELVPFQPQDHRLDRDMAALAALAAGGRLGGFLD